MECGPQRLFDVGVQRPNDRALHLRRQPRDVLEQRGDREVEVVVAFLLDAKEKSSCAGRQRMAAISSSREQARPGI
jgi:hypothetical protein